MTLNTHPHELFWLICELYFGSYYWIEKPFDQVPCLLKDPRCFVQIQDRQRLWKVRLKALEDVEEVDYI